MNKYNIKCIIIDIDGTLVDSNGLISDYTKKVIFKVVSSGIKVILATGRNIDDAIHISKICGTSEIIIANNGANIYDYNKKKFIFCNHIDKKAITNIWNNCIKYNIDTIYNSFNLRYRKYINLDKSYNEKNDIIIDNNYKILKNIYQVVLLSPSKNDLKKCTKSIVTNNVMIGNFGKGSNNIYHVDINSNKISKGLAIKKLYNLLNISKENIMCFGDSINDIDMFKYCCICVAMKNSSDCIRNNADYITKFSNNEDGVAKFIEEYFFNI